MFLPHGCFFLPKVLIRYSFVLHVSSILAQFFCFKELIRCVVTDRIQEVNLMDTIKNNLKREIIFGHCRGHYTIIILFYFEGFYEQDVRLLSRDCYF